MTDDLRIDVSELRELSGRREPERTGSFRGRLRGAVVRLLLWALAVVALATLPFIVLVRGGVMAYQSWGVGPWLALVTGVLGTSALLALYAWVAGRWLGWGRGGRRLLRRGMVGVGVAYAAYALVYVGGANVKTDEVRAEYRSLHPLLRVASSAVFLLDPGAVITDAARTEEDYWLMGLPVYEASLHFPQRDGFVHALDLRTRNRPEWGNKAVELTFWALGLHSLRHTGTADHLHVSLRLPG